MSEWIDRWPRAVSAFLILERTWMPALAMAAGLGIYNDWISTRAAAGDVALMFCMSVWVVSMRGGFNAR